MNSNRCRSLYLDTTKNTKERHKIYQKELSKIGDDQLCDIVVDSYLSPLLEKSDFCVFNKATINNIYIDKIVRIELLDSTVLMMIFDGIDYFDRSSATFKCLNPASTYEIKIENIKTFSVLLRSKKIN